jgi:hypothetical protein
MPNAFIPRATVHEWSEAIGQDPAQHTAALSRLLRDQRRLSKFIEENRESMLSGTGGVAMYLVGVILRMFELAGGRMRTATWEQVRDAEAKVGAAVDTLLPLDDKLAERARTISWRAQPHILDEALMALYMREKTPNEPDLEDAEKLKTYLLLWVCTEVLDAIWTPPASFKGETAYSYVHIVPPPLGKLK